MVRGNAVDRIYRVEVRSREAANGDALLTDIAALGITGVRRVERGALYFLRGALTEKDVARLCDELLVDPIVEVARVGLATDPVETPAGAVRVEVGLRPGVTDTVAANILARGRLLGMEGLYAAATGQSYLIYGEVGRAEIEEIARRLLYNEVIQYYEIGPLTPHVGIQPPEAKARAERIPLAQMEDEALLRLSRERLLSLDLAEMKAIQAYFAREGRDPTDVELESLAQTWSEHCVHKTFKGLIEYTEYGPNGPRTQQIDGLLRTYIQAATRAIHAPWVLSAFVDNAGIMAFDERYEVSFKVETHNHPSALEPFGGANTGVGGVVRDIIGVSARPIANTDVLCFGPLDMPLEELPTGVLHPRRIYQGVVKGIEDYGNKMGIPTVNGAIYFDPGYTANPLVYCGCVGIAPRGAHPRQAQAGDLIVVLGGRTGRDGLHGATFSSIELTDETGVTSSGAVQIGNPITEKMMLDAILQARDERLYHAITDCGAGGLSSAVSEMGRSVGAEVHLERVPLKYHGLQPWEIWLSEAQERMVLAVPPEHEARLRAICEGYSVEMTVIGTFSGDGRLRLYYDGMPVADMAMEFLHEGIPRRHLKAVWRPPSRPKQAPPERPMDAGDLLIRMLAHPNVRSKEDVVRRYDHEVQGGTVIKPFAGRWDDGPSDGAVIKPLEVRDSWRGLAIGCGFNPAYGEIDPYAMAVSAIDEAIRNVVSIGGDPGRTALLDNFCWGNPSLPDRLGTLVRACQGCYDGALHYGAPFISGKDSLNNEYTDRLTGKQVAIPPSLLISAIALVEDIRQACTADLKAPGDRLYLLGWTREELGGSYFERLLGMQYPHPPQMAQAGPRTARALHEAMRRGLVRACHDCSEGGLGVALAEMTIGGGWGAEVWLGEVPWEGAAPEDDRHILFAESNGRYVVEVAEKDAEAFEATLREAEVPFGRIGWVRSEGILRVHSEKEGELLTVPVETLRRAWRGHLAWEVGR